MGWFSDLAVVPVASVGAAAEPVVGVGAAAVAIALSGFRRSA